MILAGISGNLGVEDEERGLQFGDMCADAVAVLLEQTAALSFRFNPARRKAA